MSCPHCDPTPDGVTVRKKVVSFETHDARCPTLRTPLPTETENGPQEPNQRPFRPIHEGNEN